MNLFDMGGEQLRDLAKKYKIDAPRTASVEELRDLVAVAQEKRRLMLEEKARVERQKELQQLHGINPADKKRPAPETIDILNSDKVYCVFNNLEQKDCDVAFNWGCTHTFHLWPHFLHVMPKCVIDRLNDPKQAAGKRPIYGRRRHPSLPDTVADTIIGHERRFSFEQIPDAKPPKDARLGVVLENKIYEKLGVPFPQPVTHEER